MRSPPYYWDNFTEIEHNIHISEAESYNRSDFNTPTSQITVCILGKARIYMGSLNFPSLSCKFKNAWYVKLNNNERIYNVLCYQPIYTLPRVSFMMVRVD